MSVKQPTRDSRPKTPQHTRGPKIGQKVKGCVFRLQNRMVILQKIKDSHTKNVWKLVNLYFSSKTKNVWYIHDQFIKITKVFRSPSVNRYQNLEVIMSRNNYKNWYFKKYLKNDLVSLKLPTNLMSSPQTFILFIKKPHLCFLHLIWHISQERFMRVGLWRETSSHPREVLFLYLPLQ